MPEEALTSFTVSDACR